MTIEQERLTPTNESEALRERLVDQIIAIYNTGRPSHVPAARHVLANRAVRDAFDALAALKSPPIAGGEGDLAVLDDGMRTAAKYALEIVRKYDPGRSGLVHNLGRLEAFLDQYPARMCSDCPPAGYPTDATRCTPCPRRHAQSAKPTTSGDVGKLCERLHGVWEFIDHLPMDATQHHLNTIDQAATRIAALEAENAAAGRNIYRLQKVSTDLAEALRQCGDQFAFYAREHTAAGKLEKAATNQRFADLASSTLLAGAGS